jgi:hypothetical protein
MSKLRSLGVAAVFLAGCAVGGASARFVVPSASAQQAAALTKWEYTCVEAPGIGASEMRANAAGAQGWEMVGSLSLGSNSGWCFKRPKM